MDVPHAPRANKLRKIIVRVMVECSVEVAVVGGRITPVVNVPLTTRSSEHSQALARVPGERMPEVY
jgi:hypothetical protein